jgi:hypothetical protein
MDSSSAILIDLGVKAERIMREGFGSSAPQVLNRFQWMPGRTGRSSSVDQGGHTPSGEAATVESFVGAY